MALKFVNKPEQTDMPNLKDFERVVEHYNKKENDKIEGSKASKFAVLLHEKIGRKWQERRAKDFAEDMLGKFSGPSNLVDDMEIKQKLKDNKKNQKVWLQFQYLLLLIF